MGVGVHIVLCVCALIMMDNVWLGGVGWDDLKARGSEEFGVCACMRCSREGAVVSLICLVQCADNICVVDVGTNRQKTKPHAGRNLSVPPT